MSNIRRQLDNVIANTHQKLYNSDQILPLKVPEGILVGNVLISSEGTYKNLHQYGRVVYKNVSLNVVAIKLANLLAKNSNSVFLDTIYTADQEYSRWFLDSQILRSQYQRALTNKNYEKSDTLWARYCESRDKALTAKHAVTTLVNF
jgi:hypothetical protein